MKSLLALLFCAVPLLAGPARAEGQGPITVGLLLTLSGPGAVLGQHARDGFELYVKQHQGRLGGRDANLVVVDDELKPDVAVARARRLIEQDKASFVVGPIFSNVLAAIFRPVTTDAILISPNAGASTFAGKACSPAFFATSYENNQVHEVSGEYAQRKGYKRAFLIAPNYQAGKDAIAGFKNKFKGEILDEDYVPLTQLDFQADLARIAAAKPDVIYAFMPGGLGVNLVKQFRQSGLADTVPFLSAFTVDESTLPAQKEAAVGMYGGMTWAPNADNPANKAFAPAFEAAYKYVPASYAMQGYDAAQVIDAALTKLGGETRDKEKLQAALRGAEISSPRGPFRFNTNGYPIQDFYLVQVAKRADGQFQTEIRERVFENYADQFAKECPLK
jgi:branched-chain amino acid transport system substrate-binding protein